MKRLICLATFISAAALAACAESGNEVPALAPLHTPEVGQAVEPQPVTAAGIPHIMKMAGAPRPEVMAVPHLDYYGGHVISNVKVYSVYWGPNVDGTTQANMPQAFANVTDSRYMDWLQEYDTNVAAQDGGSSTNQHIGRGTAYQPITITPGTSATSLQDSDIYQEVNNQINASVLPQPDANTIYMVYFPSGMTITGVGGAGTSCVDFCAYHSTYIRGGTQSVFYGVMPDLSDAGCNGGCGTSAVFDNETSVSSHELIEAVTDAEIGLSSGVARPIAWYDQQPGDGEIGDICNAMQDQIAGVVVQQEYSNSNGTCITYDPTVPTPTPTPSLTPTPTPVPTPGKKKKSGCSVADVDPSGAGGLAAIGVAAMLGIAVSRRKRG